MEGLFYMGIFVIVFGIPALIAFSKIGKDLPNTEEVSHEGRIPFV